MLLSSRVINRLIKKVGHMMFLFLRSVLKIKGFLVFFCSVHAGKQRTKKEAEQHTNFHNPGGHERKIVNKLMNAEKNAREKQATAGGK